LPRGQENDHEASGETEDSSINGGVMFRIYAQRIEPYSNKVYRYGLYDSVKSAENAIVKYSLYRQFHFTVKDERDEKDDTFPEPIPYQVPPNDFQGVVSEHTHCKRRV